MADHLNASDEPRVIDRLTSLSNVHYVALVVAATFAGAVALESLGLHVEAGLASALAVFFFVLGVLTYVIFWVLGRLD